MALQDLASAAAQEGSRHVVHRAQEAVQRSGSDKVDLT